jgi:hypothetical protein
MGSCLAFLSRRSMRAVVRNTRTDVNLIVILKGVLPCSFQGASDVTV